MKKQDAALLGKRGRIPPREPDDKRSACTVGSEDAGAPICGTARICVQALTVVPQYPPYMKRNISVQFSS